MDPVSIIRAPSLKRGKNDERLSDRIKLKKIIGLTVCSNAGLDVSPTTGILAYPAGCAVVLFNSKKLIQNYLLNTSRKAITAVAYSQCGRYLATGECGINPAIKVWELDASTNGSSDSTGSGTIVAEFSGHKYAVNCVAFSPTGKYLVSVGSQHDNIVNVFDWKSNLKIASNKVSAKVVAVSFSEDGNYFVTVGNRHVKYWYLEGSRKYKEPIPLMGRSAILGELRNNDFCAVACGKGEMVESTYAITRNGHLVEFNSRRLLDKWVMCRTNSANCMVTSAKFIFVGCADAIVRVFDAITLEYITTLPRTHFLGVDVAQGVQINHMMSAPPNAKYPDTIAIVFDEARAKVSCVYNDHSLYIWDLRDIRRVGKSHSFLYHSACIWGVESVPLNYLRSESSECNLPSDCLLTCSSDDTIRVWGLDDCSSNEIYRKNIYSKELLKVIYIDNELNFIKDTDNPVNEKSSSYDGRNGVRCIKISPENGQLATGDRSGNIRIYNLNTLKLVSSIEAHDAEVLCLEYTNEKIEKKLLASASRDRLIHIFDVENGYNILQTLDDHSSSITSVKFIGSGLTFQMISCGADKSIIFRNYQKDQFLRGNNCSGKTTLYDMEIDSNAKHILTACQDRNIRVYGTQNAKHTKTFKGSHSDEGSLIKLSLDSSGIYIATSCTDKTLSVYDYYSSECMAKMYGHSELVTGLKFTNDCKYLISASGDSCIFVWQVPHDMIVTMQARLSQQALRSGHQPSIPRKLSNPFTDSIDHDQEKYGSPPSNFYGDESPGTPGYKFSEVGQLPQWAKPKPEESAASPVLGSSPSQSAQQVMAVNQKPRGRWAQRGQFDAETLDLRSIVENPLAATNAIHLNNNTPTSGYNSGSSKDVYSNYLSEDSSIDSGMENRRDLRFLKNKMPELNKLHSLNSESNTEHEHDGDVEDISDGERTSSDHGMVYYPVPLASTPTDFKVNEMKEDELRKSIRRQKLEKQGLSVAVLAAQNASTGTGTSEDEDDSTPSGDNAERSLASTLGGSSESIPQQSSSTFLQAALDGPGSLSDKEKGRKSLSALHNNDNNGKVATSMSKTYTNNKKEELLKVINEAKQKLENVGYKSSLRASQSISDLSHSANIDARNRLHRITGNNLSLMPGDDNESSIRRACSLSDLSMGKGFKTPATNSKTSSARTANSRVLPKRSASSVGKSSTSGMGLRSVSVGVLNHASDSDQDNLSGRGGVMRPTISSQNKANGVTGSGGGGSKYVNPRSAAGIISRRKGLQTAFSSGQDESSSEESPPNNTSSSNSKPAVPPRPRNIPSDQRRITSINTLLNSKKLELAATMAELPCKDSDIENADLTSQLCSNIINQLMRTTSTVIQLHQRLKTNDESTGTGRNNNLMLKELENAVIMTQTMLTKITTRNTNSSSTDLYSFNTTHSLNNNQDRINNNHNNNLNKQGNGEYIQMMDKCSDLLNKVQKQVNSSS